MSKVSIIEVKTAGQLKQFVRFPMDLYKNNPYYVPSFIKDEMKSGMQKKIRPYNIQNPNNFSQ